MRRYIKALTLLSTIIFLPLTAYSKGHPESSDQAEPPKLSKCDKFTSNMLFQINEIIHQLTGEKTAKEDTSMGRQDPCPEEDVALEIKLVFPEGTDNVEVIAKNYASGSTMTVVSAGKISTQWNVMTMSSANFLKKEDVLKLLEGSKNLKDSSILDRIKSADDGESFASFNYSKRLSAEILSLVHCELGGDEVDENFNGPYHPEKIMQTLFPCDPSVANPSSPDVQGDRVKITPKLNATTSTKSTDSTKTKESR